jgi:hypothetical protein
MGRRIGHFVNFIIVRMIQNEESKIEADPVDTRLITLGLAGDIRNGRTIQSGFSNSNSVHAPPSFGGSRSDRLGNGGYVDASERSTPSGTAAAAAQFSCRDQNMS